MHIDVFPVRITDFGEGKGFRYMSFPMGSVSLRMKFGTERVSRMVSILTTFAFVVSMSVKNL